MKINVTSALLLSLVALPVFGQPAKPQMMQGMPPGAMAPTMPPAPLTAADKEKINIMIGATFGQQLAPADVSEILDYELIAKSLQASINGHAMMTNTEMREVSKQFGEYIRGKRMVKAEAAKKAGEEFLAKNATAEGVKTLPDGLQYKVIKEGTGAHPATNASVNVNYRGTLIDGTEFDHNPNGRLSLLRVVPAWKEALPMMTVGAHWMLYVPSALAYGPNGQGAKIPGNSTLIFDIELLGAEAPPPAMPQGMMPPGMISQPGPGGTNQIVSGEIIKVPSAEGLKNGEKIEVIKAGETNTAPSPK